MALHQQIDTATAEIPNREISDVGRPRKLNNSLSFQTNAPEIQLKVDPTFDYCGKKLVTDRGKMMNFNNHLEASHASEKKTKVVN